MQFSLDQRLYNMKITKRKLCNECANRGRKVSYDSILKVINDSPYSTTYGTRKKVIDTIEELEKEKGIKSIDFD